VAKGFPLSPVKEERLSTQTESTTTEFKSVIEDAALDELSKLETQRELLARQLNEVRTQIIAVRNVLRAVRPEQRPKTSKPQKNGSAATTFKMSEDRFQQATEWLRSQDEDFEFTAAEAERALGWSNSYATQGVHQLRNAGMIRLVRKEGQKLVYKATV
jgi:hypothetical protein